MNLFGEIRRRARHIVGPVAGITLFAYFTYHVVQGDRGLIAWLKLSQQVESAQSEYDRAVAARAAFGERVRLLQPQTLDIDLLEEQVRTNLGMAHPDDVVVMGGTGLADFGRGNRRETKAPVRLSPGR
jgi:cell division protein FtsB